jgi:hypothetical protein
LKLSRGAKRLFDILIWHGKKHGFDSIFPLHATLARLLKRSVQTVLRILAELKKAGVVAVKKCGRQAATYLLSQNHVEQRLAEKSERSTKGLREVDNRSGSVKPLYSLRLAGDKASPEHGTDRKPPQTERTLAYLRTLAAAEYRRGEWR